MRHCTSCDGSNPDGARFCVACGAPLNENAEVAAPAAAPQSAQPAAVPVHVQVNLHGFSMAPPQPATAAATPGGSAQAVAMPMPMLVGLAAESAPPDPLVRTLYFVFIGWWLSFAWILVAWIFNATIIGLPVGLTMLNQLPHVATLKPATRQINVQARSGMLIYGPGRPQQAPFALRALYFVAVGWWLSLLWTVVAWMMCTSVIGLAVGFFMFDYIPAITTLERY